MLEISIYFASYGRRQDRLRYFANVNRNPVVNRTSFDFRPASGLLK